MKRQFKIALSLTLVLLIALACKELDIVRQMAIKTIDVTNVYATSADVKGDIIDIGEGTSDHGVFFHTEPNAQNGAKSSNGRAAGTGEFSVTIENLSPATKYFARTYAFDGATYAYGSEISFTTLENNGTLRDYDGNVYNWVRIGTQVWMTDNLKVIHYPNGASIPNITDNLDWGSLEDNNQNAAYCFYGNVDSYGYGALYTYAAAMNESMSTEARIQGVCPDGWHLPSDAEWTTLETYISNDGHSNNEGNALKTTNGWEGNSNGIDDYSFSALPGGLRYRDSNISEVGTKGYWWSRTQVSSETAWYFRLSNDSGQVYRYYDIKSLGLSVRCVRD